MDIREHDLYNMAARNNTNHLEKRIEELEEEVKELKKTIRDFIKLSRTKIK